MKEKTLKYIRSNISILNYNELSHIKTEITKVMITEKLGIVPTENNGKTAGLIGRYVKSTNIFDLSLTFKENKRRFLIYLEKNFEIRSDFNKIYRASELFIMNNFYYKGGDCYKVKKIDEDSIFELVRLLYKLILNLNEDSFEIDSDKIKQVTNFNEVYFRKIKVRIKCFRTGRIDILGLDKRIKSVLIRLCEKNKSGYLLPNRDYRENR